MRPGDFNGDAKPDLLAVGFPGDVNLRPGDGDGTFSAGTDVSTGEGPHGIEVADFNQDGRDDLAKKQLRIVKAGRKPKFTVTGTATDAVGNPATDEFKVSSKG